MEALQELLEHIRTKRGLSPTLRRLERFHRANTTVLDLLVQELYDVRAMGWPGASVKSLWEYARWVLTKRKVAGEPFAMNDVFQSYYARIIAILHPDLNGFFEMREPNKPERAQRGPDAEMGTVLGERHGEDYGRRLSWADGTEWQPSEPHVPKPVPRRERVRRAA